MDLQDFAKYELKDKVLFTGSQNMVPEAYFCWREVRLDGRRYTQERCVDTIPEHGRWDCIGISVSCDTYNSFD